MINTIGIIDLIVSVVVAAFIAFSDNRGDGCLMFLLGIIYVFMALVVAEIVIGILVLSVGSAFH